MSKYPRSKSPSRQWQSAKSVGPKWLSWHGLEQNALCEHWFDQKWRKDMRRVPSGVVCRSIQKKPVSWREFRVLVSGLLPKRVSHFGPMVKHIFFFWGLRETMGCCLLALSLLFFFFETGVNLGVAQAMGDLPVWGLGA